MKEFLSKCHLPEYLEILFMLIIGILLQVTDGSPFTMKERWMLVWDTDLPAEYFSQLVQKIIKTILSVIVVVRCATTYAYVVSAMLVIFCLLKKTAPKLMLLWLLIAGLKSLFMTLLEAFTGVYVCSAFGKIRKACIEFFISKALEIIFAGYLWGNVLNIYQDMERKIQDSLNLQLKDQYLMQRMDFYHMRARSLLDESTLYKTACLNNFEFKDVPQIILQMLRRDDELSEDSLLGPGMMLASVSNMGSFENLKTSQSLGELGFTDLQTTQVVGMEDDESLSYKEKALRFLKLTKNDVNKIKINRTPLDMSIFDVDEDMWTRVINSGTNVKKPKEARTKVFIRDIPQNETGEETLLKTHNLNKLEYKFAFTLSKLFNEKDNQDEESLTYSQEEEESDDESPTDLFMSNIKEGTIVQRHHLGMALKKTRGNEYAHLYKQDFMSRIGPEVFDRATKLPKVTSLANRAPDFKTRGTVSSPVIQIQSQVFIEDSKENKLNSSSNSYHSNVEVPYEQYVVQSKESFSGNKKKENNTEESIKVKDTINTEHIEQSAKSKNENQDSSENQESEFKSNYTVQSFTANLNDRIFLSPLICSDISADTAVKKTETKSCFKNRKVIMKRMSKRILNTPFRKYSLSSQCSSQNSDSGSDLYAELESNSEWQKEDIETNVKLPTDSKNSTLYDRKNDKDKNKRKPYAKDKKSEVYFLIQLLQQPLGDILMTYFDLKNKVRVYNKTNVWPQKQNIRFFNQNFDLSNYENILHHLDFDLKDKKIWKSKVLKTVESWNTRTASLTSRSYLEILRKKSLLEKLFKYEYLYLVKKWKQVLKEKNEFLEKFYSNDHQNNSSSNAQITNFDNIIDSQIKINFQNNSKMLTSLSLQNNSDEESQKSICCSLSRISNESRATDIICNKRSKKIVPDNDTQSGILKNEINVNEMQIDVKDNEKVKKTIKIVASHEDLNNDVEESSLCSQESDEPISLYYSKAANLASPLLDMRRFIYPDHIHYSYKHVKKKGFDVDISGGFPLLVRENLTVSTPVDVKNGLALTNPECEIKRRPMDLSFANTNAFAEWKYNDQNDVNLVSSEASRTHITDIISLNKRGKSSSSNLTKNKKSKKNSNIKRNDRNENPSFLKGGFLKSKSKLQGQNINYNKYLYNDYALIEKLIKMHMRFNSDRYSEFHGTESERTPIQISSTQLHSNKGRISSIYNPAISLQENKSRSEKKRIETQEKRTNDMFARLKREALLQSKNVQKSLSSNHKPV